MPNFSPIARILTLMRVLADEHMDRDITSLASLIGTSSKTIRLDISELKSQGILISEVSEANNRKVYSMDKSRFEAEIRRQLTAIGVSIQAIVSVGKRRTIRIHGKEVVGYELIIEGLYAASLGGPCWLRWNHLCNWRLGDSPAECST